MDLTKLVPGVAELAGESEGAGGASHAGLLT